MKFFKFKNKVNESLPVNLTTDNECDEETLSPEERLISDIAKWLDLNSFVAYHNYNNIAFNYAKKYLNSHSKSDTNIYDVTLYLLSDFKNKTVQNNSSYKKINISNCARLALDNKKINYFCSKVNQIINNYNLLVSKGNENKDIIKVNDKKHEFKSYLQQITQTAIKKTNSDNTAFFNYLKQLCIKQAQHGSYTLELNVNQELWKSFLIDAQNEPTESIVNDKEMLKNTLKLLIILFGNDFNILNDCDEIDKKLDYFKTQLKVFALQEHIQLIEEDNNRNSFIFNWNPTLSLDDAIKINNYQIENDKLNQTQK